MFGRSLVLEAGAMDRGRWVVVGVEVGCFGIFGVVTFLGADWIFSSGLVVGLRCCFGHAGFLATSAVDKFHFGNRTPRREFKGKEIGLHLDRRFKVAPLWSVF